MHTLHDILWNSTVEILNFRLKLLNTKPKSVRKADCIDAIKQCYVARGLEVIWNSLGELEKLAVAEACHAPACRFDELRFKAKYKSLPPFYHVPSEDRFNSYRYENKAEHATRLNLCIFPLGRENGNVVPCDVAERLREFVPKPADAEIRTLAEPAEEAGLIVRLTENDSLADLPAMLHLAEKGEFKASEKTGIPSAACSIKITNCLVGGDFYPMDVAFAPKEWSHEQEIGFIKPIAWALLLGNAKLIASNGSKSKLMPAGVKALRQAPHETIRDLWNKWIPNSAYDEFNRVNDIKGQSVKKHMTAKPPRRDAIIDALGDCPAGRWIDVDVFSDYIQATGGEFEVSNDPWKLYLCESGYGSLGYDGACGWNILQFRYLLVLLFEYAATLGLVDIAYTHPRNARNDFRNLWGADDMKWLSRYDGLRAFRITNLGAYCLGLSDDFKPSRPASLFRLSVLPSLNINVVSGQPTQADRLLLETWAEPVTDLSWRLDTERAVRAVERGRSARDFAAFLESCDDQPLPQGVEGFLRTSESDGTALRHKGEALVFDCRDGPTAELVCSRKELLNRCFRIAHSGVVVPAEHEAKFRKVVRELGLGVV
jgi:hypothetical protein